MSVFLFYGSDTYTLQQKLTRWKNEFVKKHGEANLDICDAGDTTPYKLVQKCDTMPFLGEKRLIIAKNFLKNTVTEKQKELVKFVENLSQWCVLIFVEKDEPDKRLSLYKQIKKSGKIEIFNTPQGFALTQWIMKNAQGIIDTFEAEYLAHLCGNDTWLIQNELKKLILFSQGRKITKQDIDLIVTPRLHASIFKLTDMLGQKKTQEAITILHTLVQNGEDLFKILYMIIRQCRLLIQVKDLREVKKMAAREEITLQKIPQLLKQHPYTIKIVASQSNNFDISLLKSIYEALLEIDKRIKTGKIDSGNSKQKEFLLELEKLIVKATM